MPSKEITVEILTKTNCQLCDHAKKILEIVLPDYNAKLISTNIDNNYKLVNVY